MQFESASFTITETIQFSSQKIKETRQVRFLRAKRQSRLEVFERLSLFRKILINYSQCLSIHF